MNLDFGEVLSRAWQIMWKYRIMWVFGIFASCTSGWSSGWDWDSDRAGSGPADLSLPPQVIEMLQNNPTTFLTIVIIVFCVIGIVVIFFSVIGRIGLIHSAAQAENGAENTMPLILSGICFCLYLPIFLLLRGILVAYIESAWTLTYLRLTRSPKLPPLLQEAAS